MRRSLASLFALPLSAQVPLPELELEATDGGSAFRFRNISALMRPAYFIELVGYPGPFYSPCLEVIPGRTASPGEEFRLPITNRIVGAAPEYEKTQSAKYADGSTAGTLENAGQLVALRCTMFETTRELCARLKKGETVEDLNRWAACKPVPTRQDRGEPAAIAQGIRQGLIHNAASRLSKGELEALLTTLTETELALAASRPAL